jgi:hypothetical protein
MVEFLVRAQPIFEQSKPSSGTLKNQWPFIRRTYNETFQVDNIIFWIFVFDKLIAAMYGPLDPGRWLEDALPAKTRPARLGRVLSKDGCS